jgi:hypothetical protein
MVVPPIGVQDTGRLTAIRRIVEIVRAPPFDKVRGDQIDPDPAKLSEVELENYLRRNDGTTWHPTSTCKMEPDGDSVVDDQLRVHGVRNLRICDASIMPTACKRQHERAGHHDRREGRGLDPRARRRSKLNGVIAAGARRSAQTGSTTVLVGAESERRSASQPFDRFGFGEVKPLSL